MGKRRGPGWRDEAASSLLLRHLDRLGLEGPVLVMQDSLGLVVEGLKSAGYAVTGWNRRAWKGREASPWPPPGPFGAALLRIPRAKEEILMGLHAAASVLRAGGKILVYGSGDEGIQSIPPLMDGLFTQVGTVAVGGRCRVQKGVAVPEPRGIKGELADWKTKERLDHPDVGREWISYPGVFSHGHLDRGTRLLLDSLPSIGAGAGARVLDYGCGSGVIGYVARAREEEVQVHLTDVDSVALAAAGENVPGAVLRLLDGLPDPEFGVYDAILTNPPFHLGKAEQPVLLMDLVRRAGPLLASSGRLVLVTQKRFPVREIMEEWFAEVEPLSEDSVFWVLQAQGPKGGKGRSLRGKHGRGPGP